MKSLASYTGRIQVQSMSAYIINGASGSLIAFIPILCFSVYDFTIAVELLVITVGEMQDPQQDLFMTGTRGLDPHPVNVPTFCLVVFYILGAFFIGMIIPSNDHHLLGGSSAASAFPWAIAAKDAGIKGLEFSHQCCRSLVGLSCWQLLVILVSCTLYSMMDYWNCSMNFQMLYRLANSICFPYIHLIIFFACLYEH